MSDIDGNHWGETSDDSDDSSTTQEDSLSPVIGVILMVAITVIIAALVGSFVFNLAAGIEEEPEKPRVVITEPSQENTVLVRILSMPNEYDYISVQGPTETHQITTTQDIQIDNLSNSSVITITGTYTESGAYSEDEQTTKLLYETEVTLHS